MPHVFLFILCHFLPPPAAISSTSPHCDIFPSTIPSSCLLLRNLFPQNVAATPCNISKCHIIISYLGNVTPCALAISQCYNVSPSMSAYNLSSSNVAIYGMISPPMTSACSISPNNVALSWLNASPSNVFWRHVPVMLSIFSLMSPLVILPFYNAISPLSHCCLPM